MPFQGGTESKVSGRYRHPWALFIIPGRFPEMVCGCPAHGGEDRAATVASRTAQAFGEAGLSTRTLDGGYDGIGCTDQGEYSEC